MEGNSMAGGIMPGMLGLEMPLHQPTHHHHNRHHHHLQTPPPPTLQQHLQLFASPPPQGQEHHSEADHNAGVASKHVYPFNGAGGFGAKVKPAPSSEEEPSSAFGDECGGRGVVEDLGMKQPQQQQAQLGVVAASSVSPTPSPWQRMKWTDTMVRLLVMVVYCVGDDGGPEGGSANHNSKAAKKGGSGTAGVGAALLQQQQQQQKKGKWKSVSQAMMEKGYYVSPQQCEDKFNDLNKRYKRVNDILGRGTACRVVENQALLDTMDHLSPKAKEEVRKLLNSKHLFFREMCAYHRSCAAAGAATNASSAGGGAGGGEATHHLQSCEALAAPDLSQLQQQRCFHPPDIGGAAALISARGEEVTTLRMMGSRDKIGGEGDCREEDGMAADEDEDEDNDEEEEEDDYGDGDGDDLNEDEEHTGRGGGGIGYHHRRQHRGSGAHGDEEEEDSKEFLQAGGAAKRQRRSSSSSPLFSQTSLSSSSQQQHLRVELAALAGTPEQQRQWLRGRAVEIEERQVRYRRRALALERQRFKWLRFSGNKEREMERTKLENERLCLENERMLLLLRQKEFDLPTSQHSHAAGTADHPHNSITSPNPAPSTSAA